MAERRAFLTGWVLLLLLILAIYSASLLALPGFVDEGNHLRWAAEVWQQGRVVFPFSSGKPLEIFWLAALLPTSGSLWLGRISSVLALLLTVSGLVALGRAADRPITGVMAALLYALLPLTFFHTRLAIADPLVAALGVWLVWAGVMWAKHPQRQGVMGVSLAALLLLTPLAKLSGLALWPLPLLAVWVWPTANNDRWRRLWPLLGIYLAAAMMLGGVLALAQWRYDILGEITVRSAVGSSAWLRQVAINVYDLSEWARLYVGALPLFLMGTGIVVALIERHPLRWVTLGALGLTLASFVLVAGAFPRYYLGALAFAALLAADTVVFAGDLLLPEGSDGGPEWERLAALGVVTLALGLSFAFFATTAWQQPANLTLAPIDRQQHLTDWSSGFGIREATAYVTREVTDDDTPALVLGGDLATYTVMWLYWPPATNAELFELWSAEAPDLIVDGLPADRAVYLVNDAAISSVDFTGLPIVATELAVFARPDGGQPVSVYGLTASNDQGGESR